MSLNYNISAFHPGVLFSKAPRTYFCPECDGLGEHWFDTLNWCGEPTTECGSCPECGGTGLTLLGMIMMSKIQIPMENLRWQKFTFSPT